VTLSFQLGGATEEISLQIFNIQGLLLDTPVESTFSAGTHSVIWAGTNQQGLALPSGIYLVKISSAHETHFQRITLLR